MDEDTRAFNAIIAAFGLPKKNREEQELRKKAIDEATLHAIEVPLEVMKVAHKGFEVAQAMGETGNPNSISDAGVGALALNACVEGAWLNVKINAGDLQSHPEVERMLREGAAIEQQAEAQKTMILSLIMQKINS